MNRLSPAAEKAYSVAMAICSSGVTSGHVTVYVAEQQTSFATQQGMLLGEAYNRARQIEDRQVDYYDFVFVMLCELTCVLRLSSIS